MAPRKLLTHNGTGDMAEYAGITASAGASSAGEVGVLGPNGRYDISMMPDGVGPENEVIVASEALAASDFVNVYSNAGTATCRKADASAGLGKRAHGFVKAAVAAGANATVFTDGKNDQLSGLTPGEVFLSAATPGKVVAAAPTGSGQIVQSLGVAVSATELNTSFARPILLA